MKNKFSLKNIFLIALSAYTAVGYIIFAALGKIIPMPFAEYGAFIYGYISSGNIFMTVILVAVVIFCIVFTAFFGAASRKRLFAVRVIISLFAAADCILHQYVFIMTSGYEWSYLVSAILDIIIIMALLLKEGQRDNV